MGFDRFSAYWQSFLKLDDIAFLKWIVDRFPEVKFLAGPADASPEGHQVLREGALAYQVFDRAVPVHETAIEADRTFLSLLLFKSVLIGDKSRFVYLSDENWQTLRAMTFSVIKSHGDLRLVLYALSAHDLGKTQVMVDAYQSCFGRNAEDHDHLLQELVARKPAMFAGYKQLSGANKRAYLNGFKGDLNLGQFVQGENLACHLVNISQIDRRSRAIRLLLELYDFAGVTGHMNYEVSLVMNDNNFSAFSNAIDAVTHNDALTAYQTYMKWRGCLVKVCDETTGSLSKHDFALARITALSRAFEVEQGVQIRQVWNALDKDAKETLMNELAITGLLEGEAKGILFYYAPAVIANAVKVRGSFFEGLKLGLKILIELYRTVREKVLPDGRGYVSVNVSTVAAQVREKADKAIGPFKLRDDRGAYFVDI